MRYTLISASIIRGGYALPEEVEEVVLLESQTHRALLVKNPDSYLYPLDCSVGLIKVMWSGGLLEMGSRAFPELMEGVLAGIRESRQAKRQQYPILVQQITGDVVPSESAKRREADDFVVAFDLIDKVAIKKSRRSELNRFQVALALHAKHSMQIETIDEGIYCTEDGGRVVYSYSLGVSGNPELITASFANTHLGVDQLYLELSSRPKLGRVYDLTAQMLKSSGDPLRTFLSGWSALEILVGKLFSNFEDEFLSPLSGSGVAPLRARFVDRVKDVMAGRYRLSDRFLVVSDILFSDQNPSDVQERFSLFETVQKIRNRLLHGEDVPDEDLPVEDLRRLLAECLSACTKRG